MIESSDAPSPDFEQSQDRAAFEADTGVALDARDEYQQLWWSWHGTLTRADPGGPWSRSGALLVNSPNAQQTAEIARRAAQGGASAASFDGTTQTPILPGDPLLEADMTGP